MTLSDTITVYGKSIPQKAKNTITLKLDKIIGFKYPIQENPIRGYFTKETGIDLIKNNLRQLLRTEEGERFMLPQYGCSLRRYLMEPLDQVTFTQIRDAIKTSIYRYLDKVSIGKLRVFQTKSSEIKVELLCNLKDAEAVNFNFEFKF
jgi:phage baseplate assembly protein W